MNITDYLQFVFALALVLALIGGLAWGAKRFGLGGKLVPAAVRSGEPRRLSVIEVLPLDSRRKLVLLRCDSNEHLLLINQGQAADLVIGQVEQAVSEKVPQE